MLAMPCTGQVKRPELQLALLHLPTRRSPTNCPFGLAESWRFPMAPSAEGFNRYRNTCRTGRQALKSG